MLVARDTGLSSQEPYPIEKPPRQYCFAHFTLDLECGFLRRGTEEVILRAKAFEVLACLVEHHGRLVSKTALIEAVWPDAAITDNSLAQCLLEIRRALADEEQQLIRTVTRRGYVFAAPVTTPVVEIPRQPVIAPPEPGPLPGALVRKPVSLKLLASALILLAMGAGTMFFIWPTHPTPRELTYTQITNFTDSAVSPALSPDGRMVAFYRSDNWWLTNDRIYVKLLPNGEPVQITDDPRAKYGLAFSPDGSRIAYTVSQAGWNTFTVSPLGGEPRLLLSNAAGLTWLDERRVLFSEIRTGVHMGVVTATESRSEYRHVYFPQDERRMAHLSYASPDRKWALVVEMDPVWQPCRLIPLDGSSAGRQVGPQGRCTAAAWSPDGKWMYFGAEVDGSHHLWRQLFAKGEPEQITSGPMEAQGVAVTPDGRSLITSIGMQQSAVWIHDAGGERPISSEGRVPTVNQSGLFGTRPKFSRDGASLFFLRRAEPDASIELWRTNHESGKSENVAPGFSMLEYDVSSDEKEVVFSTQPSGKATQVWLATLDRRSPPRLISSSGETSPYFGPEGQILYRLSDGKTHYLAHMNRDGSGRSKVVPYPIGNVQSISPDRRWIVAYAPWPDRGQMVTMAIPTGGGAPRRICPAANCMASWAPDGKFLDIGMHRASRTSPGQTLVLPLRSGEMLPDLPDTGISGLYDGADLPGARTIDAYEISPGPDPSVFAYVKTTVHRNLFRIALP
ncbi:MAG: eukaryotic-like serine/threonine-protein kinase [Bryobacterales bacterium]|nr:eukaryotic-like serine/threonine-protein kinase [Bryobacterales bacterium]